MPTASSPAASSIVDASGKLTPGMADPVPTSSTTTSTEHPIAIPATLPNPMTSPLTLNYVMNSASGDNPYTYTVVGPNNAMTSTATVLDQNWHHAALVVGGYALQVMPWADGSNVPTSGTDLVIAGTDSNGLLHIRTFDHAGDYTDSFEESEGGVYHLVSADASKNVLSDQPEASLPATQLAAITALKALLPTLVPPYVLIASDKSQVLGMVSTIVGQTLAPFQESLYLDGLLVAAAVARGSLQPRLHRCAEQ